MVHMFSECFNKFCKSLHRNLVPDFWAEGQGGRTLKGGALKPETAKNILLCFFVSCLYSLGYLHFRY